MCFISILQIGKLRLDSIRSFAQSNKAGERVSLFIIHPIVQREVLREGQSLARLTSQQVAEPGSRSRPDLQHTLCVLLPHSTQ